jgi:predicted nucleotidyltransferase
MERGDQAMITHAEILTFLRDSRDVLETRFSVRRIALFGSVARGTASPDSDIDILVELSQPTFDHYMDLKFFLEDHFGRPVDLVLADSLKPRLAPIIQREAVYA